VRRHSFLILLLLLLFANVISAEERELSEPSPETTPVKKFKLRFLPLPFISSDPGEKFTLGAAANLLFFDSEQTLKVIVTPVITYNSLAGVGGRLSGRYYPTPDTKLFVGFGMAQNVYRNAEVFYENLRLADAPLYLKGRFRFQQDPFGNFWGLGNRTQEADESDYNQRNFLVGGEVGFYVLRNFRVALREDFFSNDVENGIDGDTVDTVDVFGAADGVVNSSDLTHGFALVYDTRPLGDLSTRGFLIDSSFFFSKTDLGSDNNFHGFRFDLRYLLNLKQDRFVTVFRGLFNRVYGTTLPFYQLSSLGGSEELRGYPENRFIDSAKFLFAVEERIRVAQFRLFKTNFFFSLDPFAEVGEVYHSADDFSFGRIRPSGGLGLRLGIPPSTVVRTDVGFSGEGINVFIKADYPF
jgi:outer membrane protein assembly factor BamA